jgi:hypothetical protein
VIGYPMAGHRRAGLVVDTLDMAAGLGLPEDDCVIHTDSGEGEEVLLPCATHLRRCSCRLNRHEQQGR